MPRLRSWKLEPNPTAIREGRTERKTALETTGKEVTYNPGDLVSSRNINTIRPSKKLDDKVLGPFKVLKALGTSYRLQWPTTIRIHDVFHPSLLRKAADDPLPGQTNEPPRPVVVDNEDEWEVDDIPGLTAVRER